MKKNFSVFTQLSDVFGLFFLNSRILLMRMMAYRFDFFMGIIVAFCFSAMGPLFQFLLYSKSSGYPGWTWDQILLFQAVLLLINGLCDVVFGSVRPMIDTLMEKGEFDRLLLKPYPPLLLIMTNGFKPYGIGSLLIGFGATLWTLSRIGFPAGIFGVLLFIVFVAARLLFQASIQIVYCYFTVKWVYTMRLDEIIDKILSYGNYPLEIFPRFLQMIFTTLVPFAIACYWPSKVLLGPVSFMAFFCLAGTGLFFAIALLLWRGQLKSYTSAGG